MKKETVTMPSISTVPSDDIFDPSESFAVINKDSFLLVEPPAKAAQKNVNIVKPVLRSHPKTEEKNEFVFRVDLDDDPDSEQLEGRKRKRKPLDQSLAHSQTILDPHFSRHLDLKLRRLKEKEIIAERISKRSKERQQREAPIVVQKIAKTQLMTQPNVVNVTYNDDKMMGRLKRTAGTTPVQEKPLFITTVKKGEFLPPPASMASLLGLTSCERLGGAGAPTLVYSYSSRPKVVSSTGVSTLSQPNAGGARGALAALTSLAVTAAGLSSRASQAAALSYGNLMTDRRIVRGSTTAYHAGIPGDGVDEAGAAARGARAAAARRRAVARRRGIGAPGVLPGGVTRRHEPVQTEPYLEELYDKGSEMEIGVQTDLLLERMETPVYVPAKGGCDVETQIIPGDLFDFEVEVEPVLEVLVDKTIEQAITECLEEEELANGRRQAAAAAEVKAQAAASARYRQRHLLKVHNEKEKRIDEEDEAGEGVRAEQREMATALVRTHLPSLLPELFSSMKDQGYIAEATPELEETFLPWLMSEVTLEVESMITSREVLMDIVKEVIETRAELYRAMGEDEIAEMSSSNASTETSEGSHKNEGDGQPDDVDNEY